MRSRLNCVGLTIANENFAKDTIIIYAYRIHQLSSRLHRILFISLNMANSYMWKELKCVVSYMLPLVRGQFAYKRSPTKIFKFVGNLIDKKHNNRTEIIVNTFVFFWRRFFLNTELMYLFSCFHKRKICHLLRNKISN